jgi:hypothetical protein
VRSTPVFIRDLESFTPETLAPRLQLESVESAEDFIEAMTAQGVMALRRDRDADDDVVVSEDKNDATGTYQFTWVGLVLFRDVTIVVYPKYFRDREPTMLEKQQIFKVLRKTEKTASHLGPIALDGMANANKLSLMLALLDSYEENGIYSNYIRELRNNGAGDIVWERTIATFQPFIKDGRPIYLDYKTNARSQDTADFVMRLHRCVLTECSRFMEESGLREMLSVDSIELTNERLEDFGDSDLIDYRLEQERNVQYVTWKQNVIDMLRLYVNGDKALITPDSLVCLGATSRSFDHVWEDACKVAFGDCLEKHIDALGIDLNGVWANRSKETLLGIIPRPQWSRTKDEAFVDCSDVDTLKPDVVMIHKNENGSGTFCIYDAKCYVPVLEPKVRGVPGVESVTKQYLYQAAYKSFISEHGFRWVVNAFLVPTDNDTPSRIGRVAFPGVFPRQDSPFTNHIDMWALPAQEVFDSYLEDRLADINTREMLWSMSPETDSNEDA